MEFVFLVLNELNGTSDETNCERGRGSDDDVRRPGWSPSTCTDRCDRPPPTWPSESRYRQLPTCHVADPTSSTTRKLTLALYDTIHSLGCPKSHE